MSAIEVTVRGARVHNLQNINVSIPRNALVVITGVSGSGKSSLAFDTIYAEGQRRYVESLSTYARQFLDQMAKPDVDAIEGLSPAISIQQKTTSNNPRSTVATVTEIYDYLRLLMARAGVAACPSCGRPVSRQSPQDIAATILRRPARTKVVLLAPVVSGKKGGHQQLLNELRKEGFSRLRVDGELVPLDDSTQLDGRRRHDVDVVVDRLIVKDGIRARLVDSVELALRRGEGTVRIWFPDQEEEILASEHLACTACGVSLPALEPRLFSFNSPHGACPECSGLGEIPFFDPDLVVPDHSLSLEGGALAVWKSKGSWYGPLIASVAKHYKVSTKKPWKDLPEAFRNVVLYGSGDEPIEVVFDGEGREYRFTRPFEGVIGNLQRRLKETNSENVRSTLEDYQSKQPCTVCEGSRLRSEANVVKFEGRNIRELTALPITEACSLFSGLQLTGQVAEIAAPIVKEIRDRLGFLDAVGLGYLSLERRAGSLSGGEAQRIRLATQIGSALMGVLYVLDEPSIGLHQRDNSRLIATLERLRDLGNSVLVVEHDEETIRSADWVIDMGPGAGKNGGQVVAAARPDDLGKNEASLTGAYLSGARRVAEPRRPRSPTEKELVLRGARGNNLQAVTVRIPLGLLTCVTGVSGSGKSTLVNQTLLRALSQRLHGAKAKPQPYEALVGVEQLDKVIAIDQSPIGRTPRSNPATYTGLFGDIRDLFASLPDAKVRGYKAGRFSFNVKGGRCETCEGDGILKIEMHFLPDVYVTCETCQGKRYNPETLEVTYRGSSIAEVLDMTVEEALGLLGAVPAAERKLRRLREVGLGYIHLGQQATTLSGGEAQRVKLAKELARVATGRTLYILDEPTTGLHFEDVRKLLSVLQSLVDQGNSVVVIEHDIDVIDSADWVIDLGPEGGSGGGQIIAEGSPEDVAQVSDSHTGRYLAKRRAHDEKKRTPRKKRPRRRAASGD